MDDASAQPFQRRAGVGEGLVASGGETEELAGAGGGHRAADGAFHEAAASRGHVQHEVSLGVRADGAHFDEERVRRAGDQALGAAIDRVDGLGVEEAGDHDLAGVRQRARAVGIIEAGRLHAAGVAVPRDHLAAGLDQPGGHG